MTSTTPIARRFAIVTVGALMTLTAACGGGFDREAVVQDQLDDGLTQVQAECVADAMEAEFGEDPAADGELSDEDVSALLSLKFDCVGGAEE